MSKLAKALTAAAGNAAGESLYVEDVFSTYLYTGNSSTQTITNGIDLSGEGGMVWHKRRDGTAENHYVHDTERGTLQNIRTNQTNAESTGAGGLTSFNSDGFTYGSYQETGQDYASWTFRKAEKFFDVVTYTGDGVAGRTVAHNLGSTPACIIVKRLNVADNWAVYHSSLGATKYLLLNATSASGTETWWNNTAPTASEFSVDTSYIVNASGSDYVAYLFASDAGGFGDDGSESIIKCGSFTVPASSPYDTEVNLGFEPQWLLIKGASNSENWDIHDNMRGIAAGSNDNVLYANHASSEITGYDELTLTPTGFIANPNGLSPSSTYIYIAIRRPMKTPESGTEVFAAASSNTNTLVTTAFDVDAALSNILTGANHYFSSRLTAKSLLTDTTSAEQGPYDSYDYSKGYQQAISDPTFTYFFKRATGFFDVVAYTGDDVSTRTVAHNLSVTPELMIVKRRDGTGNWPTYHKGTSANPEQNYLFLNSTQAVLSSISYWNYTAPTNTHFSVRTNNDVNGVIGGKYIAYLFATLAGVSKVGSYTGTGSNVDVDCGFSAGARFILIKRTDSTGDWYVYDSERGIVAGNDPYLLLNSTAAEVTSTDYIDPLSSGFTVTSSAPAALNASGGTYIFLAIA